MGKIDNKQGYTGHFNRKWKQKESNENTTS